jgi:hypothetical protein
VARYKRYNPHQVSNCERLAFQLPADKKLKLVRVTRRRQKRTFLNPLYAFVGITERKITVKHQGEFIQVTD